MGSYDLLEGVSFILQGAQIQRQNYFLSCTFETSKVPKGSGWFFFPWKLRHFPLPHRPDRCALWADSIAHGEKSLFYYGNKNRPLWREDHQGDLLKWNNFSIRLFPYSIRLKIIIIIIFYSPAFSVDPLRWYAFFTFNPNNGRMIPRRRIKNS